jgi:DNA-binding response OmpR family regulator
VARVKAVLRRARPAGAPLAGARDVQRVGPIEIDRGAHEVRRRGVNVELTPTEFRVFETLAANVGHALTREQILEHVSTDGDIYDRTLDRHVANLRHKIEDEPGRPRLVLTVVGVGYKLVDPARSVAR